MRARLCLLVLFASCRKDAPPPAPPQGPNVVTVVGALHAVRCDSVTAVWSGTAPDDATPREYAVESLRFELPDAGTLTWHPKGTLSFSDHQFNIFSPDCRQVALLDDHYGPYHVVRVDQLAGYLTGNLAATQVGFDAGTETARVHSDALWLSPDELEFFTSCCGGVEVQRVKVGKPELLNPVFFAPSAPSGLRRTEQGGYEVAR